MNRRQATNALLIASLAGAFAAAPSVSAAGPAAAGTDKVHCYGVNKCKGTGDCGGKGHSCSSQNSCKRQAFIDMVSQPDYQKAHTHREAGLERTVLLATTPTTL